MRARGLWLGLLLSACYRGDTATPITSRPMEAASCSTDDDIKRPVVDTGDGRLRTHSRGPLTRMRRHQTQKSWIGPEVPRHVAKKVGTLELILLDEVDGGHLALYRDPHDTSKDEGGSCRMGSQVNCAYEARRYRDGKIAWSLRLNDVFSRSDNLEVQDIRLSGGTLYFNEACQSYSMDASGDCSSLVAVEPEAGRVLWRTETLISNNRFAIRGCYIVAGYGFTNEIDEVHLVDRATGRVLQKLEVASAPQRYKLAAQQVDVTLYTGVVRQYRLENMMQTRGGRLVALDDAKLGGTTYGGAGYGGAVYGGLGYGGP